ncbi:hypothetical protein SLEP1_g25696 [Rubroshorea leprosula]|uniref:Uncharacterized protein n=1 Tax=Rubroshorea leprosula TaxID=152421 RepID=A0AAV5JR05_9ROSI|nr:hypothetical protein SLEP1_g25696 [Rubroshorea leprosula]
MEIRKLRGKRRQLPSLEGELERLRGSTAACNQNFKKIKLDFSYYSSGVHC